MASFVNAASAPMRRKKKGPVAVSRTAANVPSTDADITAAVKILSASSRLPSPRRRAMPIEDPTAIISATAYAIRSRGIARFPPAKAVCPRKRPTRSISREKYIFDAIIPTAPGIAARKKSRDGFVSRKNACSELMMIPFKTIELTP